MSRRTPTGRPCLPALEGYLAEGRLEEADQVTRDLLLVLAGAEAASRGWASPEEVKAIPASDLSDIDAAWRRHSGGRLGWRAQRELWLSAGRRWEEWMLRVGWLHTDREGGPMLRYWPAREFTYSLADAPEGHLPLTNMIRGRGLLEALLEHPAWSSPAPVKAESSDGGERAAAVQRDTSEWWAELTGEYPEAEDVSEVSAVSSGGAPVSAAPQSGEASSTMKEAVAPAGAEPGVEASMDAGAKNSAQVRALDNGSPRALFQGPGVPRFRIVLLPGFEAFNVRINSQAAMRATQGFEGLEVCIFTDQDIETRPELLKAALEDADVVICSLVFDFDQVAWLKAEIQRVRVRLVWESALELMSETVVGDFKMGGGGGPSKGMPAPVRSLLSMFSSTRDEDRIAGYKQLLRSGSDLLRFLPFDSGIVADVRTWLNAYGYWSGGGSDNVATMLRYLAQRLGGLEPQRKLGQEAEELPAVVEIPDMGLLHPALTYSSGLGPFFATPAEYLDWYRGYNPRAIKENWPRVAILLYRKHVVSQLPYLYQLVNYFEESGLLPFPTFIQGVDAHIAVRDLYTTEAEEAGVREGRLEANPTMSAGAVKVDAVVSTIGFALVGGPAGSMKAGRQVEIAKELLARKNVPYVVGAPLLIQDLDSWRKIGVQGLQSTVLYSIPELDGAIDTVPLGGLVQGTEIEMVPDRAARLVRRVQRWVQLRRKAAADRRVAVVLYGYPPGIGATGTAALLDVPRSLMRVLLRLRDEGYDVGELPDDPEELLRSVADGDRAAEQGTAYRDEAERGLGSAAVGDEQLAGWLGKRRQESVEAKWGELEGGRGQLRKVGRYFLLGGRQFGNVWVAVQPPLGIPGDPMRLLFERDMTPHPQYVAFYKWLDREFGADALLHFGMHGTAEWLPGTPLGNTATCWPDELIGDAPNVYLYACNNPSESILAKRRGYGTIVSHNVPPYSRSGLYQDLQRLRGLLGDVTDDMSEGAAEPPAASEGEGADGSPALTTQGALVAAVFSAGMQQDVPPPPAGREAFDAAGGEEKLEAASEACAEALRQSSQLADYCGALRSYLAELEQRLFSTGLHMLGEPPNQEAVKSYLEAYFDGREDRPSPEALRQVAAGGAQGGEGALGEAARIRDLLARNTDEVDAIVRALNGEYVPPAPGGDLLRDGSGVLPTGRNIHALDPYRVPSPLAIARGKQAADRTLALYRAENGGAYPETIAVNLWGLEAIKTKGESVALALALVGAEPVTEGTGRIVRFELLRLEELRRPRIDVLCSLSGIFRDTFSNVIELLDDCLRRAAEADEPTEMNFVRKHALELKAQGESDQGAGARIFSNASGEFGSLVNERVVASSWQSEGELGETWSSRNAFSFGRAGEKSVQRTEVLDKLMSTTGQVVQYLDSVEYGLTDIQEYYANTGAMLRRMEDLQGRSVQASVVESYQPSVRPREMKEVLRLEYRSKLLNPKWAESMVAQGSGGAFEVSQRVTALLGWGATAKFQESWVWQQSAERYVLDEEMRTRLAEANPEAARNVVVRMLEASARGYWEPSDDVLQELQRAYDELEDKLEGMDELMSAYREQ